MKEHRKSAPIGLVAILGSLAPLACGNGDDGQQASGSGTVTEEWKEFCTGTFTEDTAIEDGFEEVLFTARAGEEYLMADYGDFFGENRAQFLYVTNAGPESFDVVADSSGGFPFTSDCMPNEGVVYYAVFADVSLYADVELTTKICDLSAGTALPATADRRGFNTADDTFTLNGPAKYEVYLNAFKEQCGGNATGFISVPQTVVHGTHTWLVPIAGVLGPS